MAILCKCYLHKSGGKRRCCRTKIRNTLILGHKIRPAAASLFSFLNQITNNQNRFMQKEKRKIQITDAKVRGFLADSKKLA